MELFFWLQLFEAHYTVESDYNAELCVWYADIIIKRAVEGKLPFSSEF
jgi:hypothetical protein